MTEVVEAYREYAPPCDASSTIRALLESVPQEYLESLWRVLLTNSGALRGDRKRRWSWSRGRKARHTNVLGLYHQAWHGDRAWIEIFVDRVLEGLPRWALRLPFIREGLLGSTLYHELGHHIHKTYRPEYRERENVADDWGRLLVRSHMRRRHKAAALVLSVLGGLVRTLRRTRFLRRGAKAVKR